MNDGYSPSKGYFFYKGVAYGAGTKVRLKSHVHIKNFNTDYIKNDIYVFYDSRQSGINMFRWCDTVSRPQHYKVHQINICNCDEDIEEIVEPIYPQIVSWQEKAVNNMFDPGFVSDSFGGVLTFIIVMLVGTIFKERFMIWIIGTAIFSLWLLYQHRT